MSTPRQLTESIRNDGYEFVRAPDMRALLEQAGPLTDWPAFAASWNDLGPDTYMADGGRYRKRRHAVFAVSAGGIVRQPAQPHYQSRDYNTLNGGIERWFLAGDRGRSAPARSLTTVLTFCRTLFGMLSPAEPGTLRCTSSASRHGAARTAARPRRACTATAWTTCWCCW